jgi:group I intron endonuclease
MMIGLVYKITSTVGKKVYVGSTQEGLNKRLQRHKGYFQGSRESMPTSKLLFEEYGVDTCSIHLIESVEFKEKSELLFRERYWIENTPNCVNIYRPIITDDEKKETKHKHYEKVKGTEEHKARSLEIQKRYYENHRDEVLERAKAYNESHKEDKSKYNKEYHEAFKQTEKYAQKTARALEWLDCECGERYQRGNKSRHMKSAKHQSKVKA